MAQLHVLGHISKFNHLVCLQKKCIRVITKSDYREHTTPLFAKLKTLTFLDIIKLKTVQIAFKAFLATLPAKIQNYFKNYTHTYNTRSNLNFSISNIRTTAKSISTIINTSIHLWNSCNNKLKSTKTIPSFKYYYKCSLLSNYQPA